MEKIKGTVEWYQPQRGFGNIKGDNGENYFVYHNQINAEGFRFLKKGWTVEFTAKETEKGMNAEDVDILSKS